MPSPSMPITNSSGKPEDVPDDVWDAAKAAFAECRDMQAMYSDGTGPAAIARALMFQRERAAAIIDGANAHYAAKHEAAKAAKNRVEAHDLQTMRIATAGLANLILGTPRTPTQAHADAGGDTL